MWDGIERRKGADWLDISINVLNVLAWVTFLAALILYHYAKPEVQYFVYNLVRQPVEVRGYWREDLKALLELSLWMCIAISIVTLIANHYRLKRKTDQRRYGLIMLAVVSVGFVTVLLMS
jgi:hypothetical protein